MTTAYQFARAECANFAGGGCAFNGSTWVEGDCALRHAGMRCGYFERAVLPLAERVPRYARIPAAYWRSIARANGMTPEAVRQVSAAEQAQSLCECGRPREKGHRFCPRCAARRRKEAARARKAKQRDSYVTLL